MVYFYGDSFTAERFSSYRLRTWLSQKGITYNDILVEEDKRHWTKLLSRKLEQDYEINAQGGWSNQDILLRVIRDLHRFTSNDTVVVLSSESTRVMMPSNIEHTEQQKRYGPGRSARSLGYPMVSVPGSILVKEYEKDNSSTMKDIWLAGIDYFTNITIPYQNDIQKYYVDLALKPLIEYVDSNICRSVVFTHKLWPMFTSWHDLGDDYEGDRHWSPEGWLDFSNFAYKTILSDKTFVSNHNTKLI